MVQQPLARLGQLAAQYSYAKQLGGLHSAYLSVAKYTQLLAQVPHSAQHGYNGNGNNTPQSIVALLLHKYAEGYKTGANAHHNFELSSKAAPSRYYPCR